MWVPIRSYTEDTATIRKWLPLCKTMLRCDWRDSQARNLVPRRHTRILCRRCGLDVQLPGTHGIPESIQQDRFTWLGPWVGQIESVPSIRHMMHPGLEVFCHHCELSKIWIRHDWIRIQFRRFWQTPAAGRLPYSPNPDYVEGICNSPLHQLPDGIYHQCILQIIPNNPDKS